MKFDLRQRLLATTLLGAAFIATPAWAQEDDRANQENGVSAVADPTNAVTENNEADTDDGEIVVTGSRIARRDLISSSPLAVVNDEEFKLSGTTNVEQVINTLPQVIPGTTAFSNNPGDGTATLDLRGLGETRNLILVNGRRYIFFDANQIVDVNTIPAFLIDSVDIVTGGASAVYGSDALAGVINFRLRSDLNGFETGGQINLTEEGDGRRLNAYVALGSGFADDRGHVTVFGEYFKRKGIFAGARARSAATQGDLLGGTGLTPTGSATTDRGRIAAPGSQTVGTICNGATVIFQGFGDDTNCNGTTNGATVGGVRQVDAGDRAALTRGAGVFGTAFGADFQTPGVASVFDNPADSFNFAPTNYLAIPQERFSLGGYGEYEISDAVSAYAEVNFVNNRVDTELAPTPVTGTIPVNIAANAAFLDAATLAQLQQTDANETLINAQLNARCAAAFVAGVSPTAAPGCVAVGSTRTNPGTLTGAATGLLPGAGIVNLSVNRRINETGSRVSMDERNAFRVLVGVKGKAFADFNYDLSYFYARTRNANIQEGNISRSAFNAAVLNGTINVFGPGTITQAGVDRISILAQNNDISTLQVATASLAGSLFNFGQGASDVGVALGAEYRKVAAEFIPDTALSSGDVVGFNAGNATEGGYNVKELFGELRVPIAAGLSFVNLLELNGAVRYSDYSLDNVGGVFTYAGGATFSPVRDITFRGQYQRAVRAPNVQELFGGQQINFPALSDPCSDRTNASAQTDAVRARCVADGVPANAVFTRAVQPNAQGQSILGGNPDLQEEVSDSYTVGLVLRPRFIPRLNITVDAYKIDIRGTIGAAGGGENNILDLCYVQGLNQFCDLVQRAPGTGIIEAPFVITATNLNQGKLETQGIDVQVDYSQPLGFGMFGDTSKLNFFFLGTYTDKFDITPVAGVDTVIKCADRFGLDCGDPRPAFKWTSRLSLIDGPLTTSVRWRHLSSTRDDDESTTFTVERLRPYNLVDLSFSADVSDAVSFTFGVNNLFDKKPQVIGSNAEQSNTYPGTFDVLGRDYFVSAAFRF